MLALVFFMRHLSHAFHTRLCLSLCCEWLSRAGDEGCGCVFVRFVDLCTDLTGFDVV